MRSPEPGDRQGQAHKVHLTPLPSSANTIWGCGTSPLSCFPPGMRDTCFSSYSWTARLNKKQDLAKKNCDKILQIMYLPQKKKKKDEARIRNYLLLSVQIQQKA